MNILRCASPGSAAVILFGMLFCTGSGSQGARQDSMQGGVAPAAWTAPSPETMPEGPVGDSIRLGLQIFNDTPKYAARYVGNKMSCGHCFSL